MMKSSTKLPNQSTVSKEQGIFSCQIYLENGPIKILHLLHKIVLPAE